MSWNECQEQPMVSQILEGSLSNDRVAHAYLFAGGQGSGKKKLAYQLAKSLLCLQQNGDSCNSCNQCLRIDSGNHPDVHVVTPDGASIKIEQVRGLQKEFSFRAVESSRKIYIIEHADKMTVQAANSLLKFLEEPSFNVTAILLTQNLHHMLTTILSRCQTIMFKELPTSKKISVLAEEGYFEPVARNACHIMGDLGRARELCQSEWFAQLRNVVLQLTKDIMDRGSYTLVLLQDKLLKSDNGNYGVSIILDMLLYWYRDLLVYHLNRQGELLNTDHLEELQRQALRMGIPSILNAMDIIMETKRRLDRNANPQLTLEWMVIQIQEVRDD